jgi:hypothetical protein
MLRYLQEQGIVGFIHGCLGREKNITLGAGRRLYWQPTVPSSGWVGGKEKILHSGPWVRELNRRMREKVWAFVDMRKCRIKRKKHCMSPTAKTTGPFADASNSILPWRLTYTQWGKGGIKKVLIRATTTEEKIMPKDVISNKLVTEFYRNFLCFRLHISIVSLYY